MADITKAEAPLLVMTTVGIWRCFSDAKTNMDLKVWRLFIELDKNKTQTCFSHSCWFIDENSRSLRLNLKLNPGCRPGLRSSDLRFSLHHSVMDAGTECWNDFPWFTQLLLIVQISGFILCDGELARCRHVRWDKIIILFLGKMIKSNNLFYFSFTFFRL